MVLAFYTISFLVAKMNAALNIDVEDDNRLVRIELESLKNIQIAEEAGSETEIKEETNDALDENIEI